MSDCEELIASHYSFKKLEFVKSLLHESAFQVVFKRVQFNLVFVPFQGLPTPEK